MKIWGAKTAGNTMRVAIFLAEKGIDLPFEPVDLFQGAHREPSFVARNPVAQIPVLELDDGTCISETVAICRYFERLQPDPPLMGVGALDEAIVEMWQRRIEFNLYAPGREVVRHTVPNIKALEPVQLAEWAELNRPRVAAGLEMLDAQLRSAPFVAGERFTVADITAIFTMRMVDRLQLDASALEGVARWRAAVFARPSVISVYGAPAT